ncbi:MAG: chloride channel protein, partial [Candidatus Jettenia caeni]|nr:chloride channel protein [Candidatus Jettenia caeni]
MFGQLSRLSDNLVRSLVAAGAAGGIAAGFNAPITGVFFALEIIVGEL